MTEGSGSLKPLSYLVAFALLVGSGCGGAARSVDGGVTGDAQPQDAAPDASSDALVLQDANMPLPTPTITRIRSVFQLIHGAAVHDSGRLYLADSYAEFDATPRVYWLDPPYDGELHPTDITGTIPAGLVWHDALLYVCDVGADTVRVFTEELALVHTYNVPQPWNAVPIDDEGTLLAVTFNGRVVRVPRAGEGSVVVSRLEFPFGLAVLPPDQFVVVEQGTQASIGGGVTRFDFEGNRLESIEYGWINPEGIAVDGHGNLWVAETALGQAVRIDRAGTAESLFDGLTLPAVFTTFPNGDLLMVTVRGDTALYRIAVN